MMVDAGAAIAVVWATIGGITSTVCDWPSVTVFLASEACSSAGTGITNVAPHCGHTPRLPARNVLTLSLCPFGHENRIPISCPQRHVAIGRSCGGVKPFTLGANVPTESEVANYLHDPVRCNQSPIICTLL